MNTTRPAIAFSNWNIDHYERSFDLKDSSVRSVFEPAYKSLRKYCRCQSLAMALYVRECEIDSRTRWVMDEPGVIYYELDGRSHPYYPDFKVGMWDAARLHTPAVEAPKKMVEIKSARYRGDQDLLAKFARIADVCRDQGFEFELIFSDRLYREPKRTNVALIHYYRQTDVTEREMLVLRDHLGKHQQDTIEGAIGSCSGIDLPKICALVAKGYVWINLFKPITSQATIRLPRSYN